MSRIARSVAAALTAVAAAVAVGCGGSDEVVTVTEQTRTIVEQAPPAAEPAAQPARKRKKRATAKQNAVVDSGSAGGSVTVPDVVGMDHQLAQDTMQAAGLYLLDEVDCTGQDRLLLWDRNWTVVEQDPPAGSKASEDTTVTLCAKKDGE